MSDDPSLTPLHGDADGSVGPREFVARLGLHEGADGARRPRVVADMIASVDGRAAVDGRSVALGAPADRELLRELRTACDAVLVGSATLAAERYATLLDPPQRALRAAQGRPEHPLIATVSRDLAIDRGIPVLSEDETPVCVYTQAGGEVPGAEVRRLGDLTLRAVLADLAADGMRCVLCEGGPGLLLRLIAEGCLDDLFLTVSPMLVGGDAPGILAGAPLDGPPRLALRGVHRAGDHLFLHYAAAP